ncbi:trigger factor [Alphaproteobacteria bacterium]|nr:trigger factor [Alphaproteobacteria bacterium]
MEIKEKKTTGLKREFEITITNKTINELVQNKISELAPKASIPGFRPGKVPHSIIKSRFGKQIFGEVVNESLNNASKKIVDDFKINAATQPKMDVKTLDEGKDIKVDYSVEIMPEFKVPDLTKLKITRPIVKVEEKQVDESIKRIASQNSKTEKIKKERKTKLNDTVVIDFEGKINNEVFEGGSAKGHNLKIGSNSFIPGFEDKLIGKSSGQNFDIDLNFPKDYQAKELAGKKVIFNVTINEIREDIKTEINNDFAKSLGLDNLEALKKSVKEQIINQHSIQSRSKMKREILDLLANSADFDLPNALVEDEYQSVCMAMKPNQKTVDDQKDKPNDEGMSKSEKDDALTISKRRVRLGLILAEIGRLNNIKVEEKDTQNAMMQELQRYPGREKEILEYFKKNPDAQNQLSGPVFEDKIIDFITELAEVKEKVVNEEDLYKEDNIDIKDELKKEKSNKSKAKVSKKK